MSDLDRMIALATETRERAYTPFSGFKVGACLKTPDGRLFTACNVENAAYPQSQCAEASAIGAMIAGGETEIAEVVIVAESQEICTPCGGCRQRLAEFASPDTPIHICSPDGLRITFTLGELLPHAFKFEPPGR